MKKFIVSIFVGFLILVFGAASYAMEFKASGFIEASSHWGNNFYNNPYEMTGNFYGGAIGGGVYGGPVVYPLDKTRAWLEERARLRFDAIADKNVSGTIYMELDSSRWGEASGGRNRAGAWMGDEAGFEIKNAYITFGLPVIPVPVTMQVGIQPLAVRELLYNDGAGITAGIKIDPAFIKLGWYKAVENLDYAADDDDIYLVDVSTKFQALTVGLFGLYYNMNTFGMVGQTSAVRDYAGDMMWIGLYAGGKLGPVNLNFDFMYDNGTVEDHRDVVTKYKDVDYSGWAISAKVDYPWEKFSFGVWGVYGTGADTQDTNATGVPNAAGLDKMKGFVVPPRNETGGDWSLIFFGTGGGGFNRAVTGYLGSPGGAGYMGRGMHGGTWGIGPVVSYEVNPSWKAQMRLFFIGDTVKNGNVVASPLEDDGVTLRDDDYIGTEVNLLNYFKIYKNLLLNVGFAYMFAGDGMDYYNATTASNDSPDNPWLVMTRLIYLF